MSYIVSETVLSTFWAFAQADLYEAIIEVLFYGILLVLVAFAANLLSRRQAAGGRILGGATAVMFILATVQLGARLQATVEACRVFYLAMQGETAPQSKLANEAMSRYVDLNFAEDVLLVTNNAFTDGVLIYRCYLIWARNKYILIGPGLLLLLTSILSYISAVEGDYPSAAGPSIDLRIGFLMGVFTNILLVGLTAGRIFYTRQKSRGYLKNDVVRRYNTAMAMVLESGAIVCAWVLAYVVVRSISPPTVWRVFRGGLAQLLNIVPTLIVVQVGLGHTIQGGSGETSWRNKTQTSMGKESMAEKESSEV